MDKKTIDKIITDIIYKNTTTVKCSRTTINGADRRVIENFNSDDYPQGHDERMELYDKHEKAQLKHHYTEPQNDAVRYYGHNGFWRINGKLYNTKNYRADIKMGFVDETLLNNQIKALQSAIDDGTHVPHNAITERIGHWEKGHKPGDVVVQDGFASTSYDYGNNISGGENNYEITYYIPSGSKGVLLTKKQFHCLNESELLLGMKTRQYVLSQDDDKRTVEVLILPDR